LKNCINYFSQEIKTLVQLTSTLSVTDVSVRERHRAAATKRGFLPTQRTQRTQRNKPSSRNARNDRFDPRLLAVASAACVAFVAYVVACVALDGSQALVSGVVVSAACAKAAGAYFN